MLPTEATPSKFNHDNSDSLESNTDTKIACKRKKRGYPSGASWMRAIDPGRLRRGDAQLSGCRFDTVKPTLIVAERCPRALCCSDGVVALAKHDI